MNRTLAKSILTNPVTVLLGGFASLLVAQIIASLAVNVLGIESELLVAGLITTISIGVLAAIAWGLLTFTGLSWRGLGIVKPKAGWVKRLAFYTGLYYILSFLLQLITTLVVPQFDPTQAQDVGISSYSLGVFIQSFMVLVVLTPVLEEFFFRGLLFRGLRKNLSFVVAAGATSVLFALAHGQWNVALDTFVLGIFLAKLVEETGSLLPALVLHAGKNAIALSLLFALQVLQ